jgi:glyoxylase-like metal-dependent hydrolase (beta-lactamase superfamily II)
MHADTFNLQASPPPAVTVSGTIIRAFRDGLLPTRIDVAVGLDIAECERMTGVGRDETLYLSVNEYLFDIDGKLCLIDAGAGPHMYPSLGRLAGNLRHAGYPPEEIACVLITHLHGDHMHGLVDADGNAVFPNAELILHDAEAAFWIDCPPEGDPRVDRNLPHVRRNLAPYRGRIRRVGNGEVMPGVRAHLCPGHTPGHTAWIIGSGPQTAIMWGDLVHLEGVQFARPDIAVTYDRDGAQAAQSRREVFDMCVADNLIVLGAHLAFPGFKRLERAGDRYRLLDI